MPETLRVNPDALTRAGLVPYVTAWSAEQHDVDVTVVVRPQGDGIAYKDEATADRDRRGVLWQRLLVARGQGKPDFGKVHGLRQRRAMRKLLCQVCAGPADRNERGVLWLIGDHRDDWPNWPENMGEVDPPVCLPCAKQAIRLCPFLRRGYVAVRVRAPRIEGVYGNIYCASPGGPVAKRIDTDTVRFDDPRIRWTVAGQVAMGLHGCIFVDLDAELTAAGLSAR